MYTGHLVEMACSWTHSQLSSIVYTESDHNSANMLPKFIRRRKTFNKHIIDDRSIPTSKWWRNVVDHVSYFSKGRMKLLRNSPFMQFEVELDDPSSCQRRYNRLHYDGNYQLCDKVDSSKIVEKRNVQTQSKVPCKVSRLRWILNIYPSIWRKPNICQLTACRNKSSSKSCL